MNYNLRLCLILLNRFLRDKIYEHFDAYSSFICLKSRLMILLGILSCLDSRPHIDKVCLEALKSIVRTAHSFSYGLSLKVLYCTLVRSILEYGNIIWDANTISAALSNLNVCRDGFFGLLVLFIKIPHTHWLWL